ncbi:unnamed protein product (mitochondrion) [Plasmodiophora brassicae]|uniref:Uncharacterized protein n=1 Tax=Plasmodiophora brassicae TaxID=37360 RepID=A0A0G4IPV9_PLABS|nr:hypothetical protein PBRA_000566 [Plasmodiophora brassicae]SPQ97532.1 unnamed protein product [Plasmodiophora brassicae]
MYALMALSLGDGRAEGAAGGHGKPVDIATFYAREAQDTQRGARQEALGRLVRDEFRLQCQGGTFDAPRNLFSPADVSYGIAPVRDAALFESEKIAVWQQLNAHTALAAVIASDDDPSAALWALRDLAATLARSLRVPVTSVSVDLIEENPDAFYVVADRIAPFGRVNLHERGDWRLLDNGPCDT